MAQPVNTTGPPRNYGVLLYRGYDFQDVSGPLEVLYGISNTHQINLFLLAQTLDPVLTRPRMAAMNPTNSSVYPTTLPTHTFADAPDLDVLIIPGGLGMRASDELLQTELKYITETYPKVKYLITVCTGSALLARTGILDGRRATTNKTSWKGVVHFGPLVKWVAPARWVVDGNIWTSAGVTAGFDIMFAFVKTMYSDGQELVDVWAKSIEYVPHEDSSWDPFSAMNGIPTQNQL
ncbi:class I glutamine amidotransferase-like protein [Coniochaeta ligniaria NRRL 30616]|uniref:Class I glutamine amidotransferase-like protein n=1 Tax=Coniochaeta ligniaria NRRL 30616 TaxID=1408157 RepID=A0A1J7IXP3_9PEZI|nr:class I glutamine amidotransferase-like protein [Coniochaeta ligniaria NRRL 30616]